MGYPSERRISRELHLKREGRGVGVNLQDDVVCLSQTFRKALQTGRTENSGQKRGFRSALLKRVGPSGVSFDFLAFNLTNYGKAELFTKAATNTKSVCCAIKRRQGMQYVKLTRKSNRMDYHRAKGKKKESTDFNCNLQVMPTDSTTAH